MRPEDQRSLMRELMHKYLVLDRRLQVVLDGLVPPTTTGYLHNDESWTIAWVHYGEYDVELELAIDPPRGAHEWQHPRIDLLQILQNQLGCDSIGCRALKSGKVRYIASYNREKAK